MKTNWLRRAAATAATAGILAAGAVTMASPASAVGRSACYQNAVMNHGNITGADIAWVKMYWPNQSTRLMTAPYDKASVPDRGRVGHGTKFWALCSTKHWRWVYVQVISGPHAGQYGWIDRWNTTLYW